MTKLEKVQHSLDLTKNKLAATKARLAATHQIIETYQQAIKVLTDALEASAPAATMAIHTEGTPVPNMQQWEAQLDEAPDGVLKDNTGKPLSVDDLHTHLGIVYNEGYIPVDDDFIPGTSWGPTREPDPTEEP